MKRIRTILFWAGVALLLLSAANAEDKCLACHSQMGDKPSKMFLGDVHNKKGITCAGCHGGNSNTDEVEEAMNSKKGYLGVPSGDAISQACANCHSNASRMVKEYQSDLTRKQLELLTGSVHGKLSTTGKERIVQCTTCHNAHGIVSATNPASPVYPLNVTKTCAKCHANATFMRQYNPALSIDQMEKYRTSVHGKKNAQGDAKVAACASCHGSHDIRSVADVKSKVYATNLPATCGKCHANAGYMKEYKIPSDQVKKFTSSVHGKALLEKNDLGAPSCNDCHGNHGAVPPGVESISKVCGTCHALNADLFSASPHKKAFDTRRLPECETCHGNHEIVSAPSELLGVSSDAVCARCHSETKNTKGYAVAKSMRQLVDSLEHEELHVNALVDDAQQRGIEMGEAEFKLRDVRQSRLESRTMVHSFSGEKMKEVIDKGLGVSSVVAAEVNLAVEDFYFRRWGLGVATLIISILAGSLYLMIRRIERAQAASSDIE